MSTGTILVYIGIAVASVIAIGTLVLWVIPYRIALQKTSVPPRKRRKLARTVVLAVCALLVAGGAALLSASPAKPTPKPRAISSALRPQITYPPSGADVGCVLTVSGTANVPAGDILVVGSALQGGSYIPFQADAQWSSTKSWHATVYFGKPADANQLFTIEAVVPPQTWKDYLLDEALYYDPHAGTTWWSSGNPPVPGPDFAPPVIVKRLPVNGQCP